MPPCNISKGWPGVLMDKLQAITSHPNRMKKLFFSLSFFWNTADELTTSVRPSATPTEVEGGVWQQSLSGRQQEQGKQIAAAASSSLLSMDSSLLRRLHALHSVSFFYCLPYARSTGEIRSELLLYHNVWFISTLEGFAMSQFHLQKP